jgi:16S rRNA (cytosine967-C5)-methyltransferase
MQDDPRRLAVFALRGVGRGRFADDALDQVLRKARLAPVDRRLLTELVYGCIRRQRTLDAIIDQLATQKSSQQPPDLQLILRLGLYQIFFLNQIPASAAVNTSVNLAKQCGLGKLSGVVNGILRQSIRLTDLNPHLQSPSTAEHLDLRHVFLTLGIPLPSRAASRLGLLYSFPDWMVDLWLNSLGLEETECLCQWFNQTPTVDLRIHSMRVSVNQVEAALQSAGVTVKRLPGLPNGLRIIGNSGPVQQLPGFAEGWWTIQDASAQMVSYLLDPQPGEKIIDACAAPGGKTTHIAELMGDRGELWACDRSPSRLKKLNQNIERLNLQSIQVITQDSRTLNRFTGQADRVLVDAPCSGLGTLHRHADARWRQTPETVWGLVQIQAELLNQAATWVKSNGFLVYATCTLHPAENEAVICQFLQEHEEWAIAPPPTSNPAANFTETDGWIKVWPHRHQMDGFFMVRLQRK